MNDKDRSWATRLETHFGDRVVRCYADRWPNAFEMLEDTVRRDPHGEALVCGERRLDWSQVRERVLRLAEGLRQRGLQPGDRVAVLLGNDIEFVVTVFAAFAAGAIAVTLGTREQMPGIAHALQNSGARFLVHEAGLVERLPDPSAVPALEHRIVVGACDVSEAFESVLASGPLSAPVRVSEDDVALIMYTSGTTGLPKGAMLTHLNLVHSVLHYAQVLGLGPRERGCAVVPLSHVTGVVGCLMVMVGTGGTLLIVPEFRAARFVELVERERMTFTIMVPAMYSLCLLQEDFGRRDLSAWRVGAYGGAAMAPATIDALARTLPGLALSNCYGATETASPATIMPPQHTAARPDSVGRAVPCAEIRVMDELGCERPAGEVGELWLKGPMVVRGYWNKPAATASGFVDGFWRSGDIGTVDDTGFVRVLDRNKDMLNRGGYKIYSIEVENVLAQHPGVLEAAVVAKPCPVLGERVHVFVATRPGQAPTPDELRRFCEPRLSDYKVPESYTVGSEPLPRNVNGKLLKRELRERLLAPGFVPEPGERTDAR